MYKQLQVLPYEPGWVVEFEAERDRIAHQLGAPLIPGFWNKWEVVQIDTRVELLSTTLSHTFESRECMGHPAFWNLT
jgi:hypothetical protein